MVHCCLIMLLVSVSQPLNLPCKLSISLWSLWGQGIPDCNDGIPTFSVRGYFVFMSSRPSPFAELGFEADFRWAPALELHPLSLNIVDFPLIFCVLIGVSWKADVILFLTSLVLCTSIINIYICGCIRIRFPAYITVIWLEVLFWIGNGNSVCGVEAQCVQFVSKFYSVAAL